MISISAINSLEIGNKNFENFEKVLDPSIEENFKEKRKEKANELSRMKFYYEYTDQNVLEIKGKDFKNFEKESILLKENIGKENLNES